MTEAELDEKVKTRFEDDPMRSHLDTWERLTEEISLAGRSTLYLAETGCHRSDRHIQEYHRELLTFRLECLQTRPEKPVTNAELHMRKYRRTLKEAAACVETQIASLKEEMYSVYDRHHAAERPGYMNDAHEVQMDTMRALICREQTLLDGLRDRFLDTRRNEIH